MLAHLDAIKKFIDGEYNYCIICEDDIHIKKSFKEDICQILLDFKTLGLDILLLGYLINFNPRYSNSSFNLKNIFTYHDYPNDLWGGQMYLINRNYANFIFSTYTIQWAQINSYPFSADWTITKNGNRAIIYPMLAIEEGGTNATDNGQLNYHQSCHVFNFNPSLYI